MRLLDILSEARIQTRVELQTKQQALRALAQLFARSVPVFDALQVEAILEERERLASTGVGSGVAIPHGRVPGTQGLQAALLTSSQGIPFDAVDGAPVHLVFAVLGPPERAGEHLRVLARLSRVLRSARVREQLLAAADARTVCDVLARADGGS